MHFRSYVLGVDLGAEVGGGSYSAQVIQLNAGTNDRCGPALMKLTLPQSGRAWLDFPASPQFEESTEVTRELVALLHEKTGEWLKENP